MTFMPDPSVTDWGAPAWSAPLPDTPLWRARERAEEALYASQAGTDLQLNHRRCYPAVDAILAALHLSEVCAVCGMSEADCVGQDHGEYEHDYCGLVYVPHAVTSGDAEAPDATRGEVGQ